MKRAATVLGLVTAFLIWAGPSGAGTAAPLVTVEVAGTQASFTPNVACEQLAVSVGTPAGEVFSTTFPAEEPAVLDFATADGPLPDGSYSYEVRLLSPGAARGARSEAENAVAGTGGGDLAPPTQTGALLMRGGKLLAPGAVEPAVGLSPLAADGGLEQPLDAVTYDDTIITGSLCVGYDCATDGSENFGFDTIRMKENNTRLKFDDTSTSAGFPANDWTIVANDSASGGLNYLAFQDTTNSKTPLLVEANAATGSLHVNSSGRVGLGTSTPVLKLHLRLGDTPAVRLEQDNSSGWTAQTWDIAANESNFFVRDTTGGSKLPFRIQPGAPTNSLTMKSDGKVGIGTWSPAYALEVEKTGENAAVVTDRTDGATNFMNSTASYAQFGSASNHPVRILVNSAWKLTLNADNSVSAANGASLTAGGVWQNASSRSLKDNVVELSPTEAAATLRDLTPVRYTYKADPDEKHVGFIAEDVPALVAAKDRRSLSPMDITAVLTKVVQEQQRVIAEQAQAIRTLGEKADALAALVESLRSAVAPGALP